MESKAKLMSILSNLRKNNAILLANTLIRLITNVKKTLVRFYKN